MHLFHIQSEAMKQKYKEDQLSEIFSNHASKASPIHYINPFIQDSA